MGLLQIVDPFVGKYYSQEWVKSNILRLDDKEIKDIQKQMDKEQQILVQQAEVQGQVQLAMQQPTMDAQAQQQQAMAQQQQAAQAQQPQQDQGAQDQQEADAEAEQEDTQQSKGKVTKLKTGTWPN
jgi:phage terminase small subunit